MNIKELKEALANIGKATTLTLDDEEIDKDGAKFIAKAIEANKTITTLYLGCNKIGEEGAKFIAEALKLNTNITTLYLEDNKIGKKGINFIADALKVNTTLTTLHLGCNKIGNDGAKFIAEALKLNTTITTLDLISNKIGKEGAKFIAEALKLNTTITTLDLGSNNIGNDGAKFIAKAIEANKTITTLYLRCNIICKKGIHLIEDVLKANKLLVKKTATFLVKTFIKEKHTIKKKHTSITDQIKYFKYYQVSDKQLLEKYLDEKLEDSQKPSVSNKAIQKYIARNFFKLCGVFKDEKEEGEELLSANKDSFQEDKIDLQIEEGLPLGSKRKAKNSSGSRKKCKQEVESKHPFNNEDLSEYIVSFLGKYSLCSIKPPKPPSTQLGKSTDSYSDNNLFNEFCASNSSDNDTFNKFFGSNSIDDDLFNELFGSNTVNLFDLG